MNSIAEKFLTTFGAELDLVAAAPGRVNLIGEHIDYSEGFVLPFAITDRTFAAVRKRDDTIVRIASAQRRNKIVTLDIKDVKPGLKGEWERYALGVLWSMGIKSGVDILIDGHVPLGAGLSSSAALECSVATAMNHLFDMGFNLEELARLTQKAENQYVGVPCGIMDQSVSLMATQGFALLLDCRDLSSRNIPFDIASHGLKTKLLDTRKTTPNFRLAEKWACQIGGAENHRYGLFDMIMIKDNHVDFAGGIKQALEKSFAYNKTLPSPLAIEIEVRNETELDEVLAIGGVQRIMLDNFTPDRLRDAIRKINGRFITEASGGITEKTLRAYGETGVDYISVGALTHQVKSLDLSLKAK